MKILKNTTASDVFITDVGINVLASSNYTISAIDYHLFAQSSDVILKISNGTFIVNDGSYDLTVAQGVALIHGSFIKKEISFDTVLLNTNRLKVDVQLNDQLLKVDSADQTMGYLGAKIIAESGATTTTVLNPSSAETLQIGLANVAGAGTYGSATQIPVFTKDSKGRVTSVTNTTITPSTPYLDHWHGTTQYTNAALRKYSNLGTTDANGRVTVNLTQNGSVGGISLFSAILSAQAIGVDASGVAIQAINLFIETITATQIVFRATRGTSVGVLIGGTVLSIQYAGAGYSVYVEVTGVHF